LYAASNFPFNRTLGHEHATNGAHLLNKNLTNVVTDRDIVANFFSPTLNSLDKLTECTSVIAG